MRILMVAQSFSPVVGGEERIVEDLSAELARRGHEVGVATLSQPLGEPPRRDDGVEVHLLDSTLHHIPGLPADPERRYAPPGPDPLALRGLHRVIAQTRPEVIHAHNWLAHSYLPLERRSGAAFVLSLHDYSLICATKRFFYRGGLCSGPGARKCLAHSFEYYGVAKGSMAAIGTRASGAWLRRSVDMFLPVSEAVRELSALGPDLPQRVVPNFIGELPPAPAADEPRLAELPTDPFLLYFGDITEDKGVRLLVEAYAQLEQRPPLVLIGRRLIDDLPSPAGLHVLDRMPHRVVIEAVRRSAFVLAPSLLPESFGIVALEAAAAGKAAIVSDIGGLKDVVTDGQSGILVAAGDRAGLAAAMRRLCEDPELRARMGKAGAERAKLFGPDVVVPQFESAYREAIDARLRRGLPAADR